MRCFAVVALLMGTAVSVASAQQPDGKVIYQAQCKKCHGVLGTPPKTMKEKYPDIITMDSEFIAHRSNDSIVVILKKGKGEGMKSFKEKLTAEEMAAVAAYVRELATKR